MISKLGIGNLQPSSFNLRLLSYPNPFRDETTITYELREAGKTRLQVFDAIGRLVAILVDEEQAVGPHTVVWDGHSQTGARLSTGIYFYRLSTGGLVRMGRTVLAR